MESEHGIRLGSVQAHYEPRQGLVFKDVHNPLNMITVCDSDLASMIEYVCRQSPITRQAATSLSPPDDEESGD